LGSNIIYIRTLRSNSLYPDLGNLNVKSPLVPNLESITRVGRQPKASLLRNIQKLAI
jgi:hypothetical protein